MKGINYLSLAPFMDHYVTKEAVETKPYTFRPYVQEDVNFIQSSWGNSYWQGNNNKPFLSSNEFHSFHRPIRTRILQKPSATAIICVLEKDPNAILGWVLVEKLDSSDALILHYLYVKEAVKREGIATELIKRALPTDAVIFTHLTEVGREIRQKRASVCWNWKFIPHLV